MTQYLVVVRTARDDAPQRLFDCPVLATEFAQYLHPEDIADPFGTIRDGVELAEPPLAIVRFTDGDLPELFSTIERDDWPSDLAGDRKKYVAALR